MFNTNFLSMKIYKIFTILLSILLLSSCADLTQTGLTQLDNTTLKQKKCCKKGHVFAIRGFLGIWSRGMNTISYKAKDELHVASTSVGCVEQDRLADFIIKSYENHTLKPPIILVGHSFGADAVIDLSWNLYRKGIPVHLLIMTDPVVPKKIPPNVIHCYNVYKSHPMTDFIPAYRGIKVDAVDAGRTWVENVNLRTLPIDKDDVTHFNIDQYQPVQGMVLAEIQKEVLKTPDNQIE